MPLSARDNISDRKFPFLCLLPAQLPLGVHYRPGGSSYTSDASSPWWSWFYLPPPPLFKNLDQPMFGSISKWCLQSMIGSCSVLRHSLPAATPGVGRGQGGQPMSTLQCAQPAPGLQTWNPACLSAPSFPVLVLGCRAFSLPVLAGGGRVVLGCPWQSLEPESHSRNHHLQP